MEQRFFNLQEGEKVLYEIKPLPGLRWYFFFRGFLRIVVPITIAFIYIFNFIDIVPDVFENFSENFFAKLSITGGMGFVIGVAVNFVFSFLEYGKQFYWITDKRMIYKRGIVGYRITSIPYERISDVIISRTFVERLFGFGSIHVQSLAGQASGASSLGSEGVLLAVPEPEKLQELIFKLVKLKRKTEGLSF